MQVTYSRSHRDLAAVLLFFLPLHTYGLIYVCSRVGAAVPELLNSLYLLYWYRK